MSHRRIAGGRLGRLAVAALTANALALAGAAGSDAAPPALPTLPVTLTATSVSVGTAPSAGAVNVVTKVTGSVKEPSIVFVRLDAGATPAQVWAFANSKAGQQIDGIRRYGSIVFDAEPGESQVALPAGEYVALLIVGEGKPRAYTPFTVKPSASPVALPTPSAVIKSIEFKFIAPRVLRDGELVRFENEGFLTHMFIAVPTKGRFAARQFISAMLKNKEKAAFKHVAGTPVELAGPLSWGAYQQEVITAKPGFYVLVCFMDTQDHRNHAVLGMDRVIEITR
jgi:hypothetical protein